ncbi:Outer membrane cobalamin translocator [Afipia felis]|uniref:Outer membrane cobalamin translocator n=1 Tax=Afipia felis TaxID=1035 RepID=A0A090MMS4_AFIFE|nr:TonB-dependent receptor [Afipia felis]CEG07587.1 Outer membrane cobalamin translocator [Afipia felis]
MTLHQSSSRRRISPALLSALLASAAFIPSAQAQQTEPPLPAIQVSPAPKKPNQHLPKNRKRVDAKPKPAEASAAPANLPNNLVTSPTTIPTPVSQIASSITVITAKDIQDTQRRTVPDLLQTVPGLNVAPNAPGGLTSVFIRGANSYHTKVLIDGIDVSDPSSPNRAFDFGPLTTFGLEQVEVLRGPQGGLYGSDAMGGVISMTTKTGKGAPQWSTLLEGGSFGTFNQATSVSGSTSDTRYAFTTSHMRVDSTPVVPLSSLPPGQKRNNDFYDNLTFHGKVSHDFSEMFSVNAVARYTDAHLRYTESDGFNPVTFATVPNPIQSRSDSKQFNGLVEGVFKLLDGRFNNHVGVTYTDVQRNTTDPYGPPFYGSDTPNSSYHGDRAKVYWRSDLALVMGQTLVTGVEHETERGRIDQAVFNIPVAAGSIQNLGSYAELQSNFFDRLFIVSNVRHDQNDHFGGHDTFRVAPAIVIPETGTKLKASYGTGFHAPSIDQLYSTNPAFGVVSNLNLKPEESKGYDYGFEQALFNKRLQFGGTWYHNSFNNLIESFQPVPTDPTLFSYENVALATTHGLEAFTSFALTESLTLRGDYTHTIATDDTKHIALKRRPAHKWSAQAKWAATDRLTLTATALWISSWSDADATGATVRAPGYQLLNLAANYKVDQNWSVFGRIDNVLDRHYQNPLGFEKTGIGVYGGLRFVTN